jgi:trehalose 6-phosphate phosphatase
VIRPICESKVGPGAAQLQVTVLPGVQTGYLVRVTSTSRPPWPNDPALFLDLDGTLLDFAPDPAGVEVSSRLRSILARLPAATKGAIAFVSGRTLADLDRLLAPGEFPLAAIHGIERRDANGKLRRAEADASEIERMHRVLEKIAAQYPETLVEHKGMTLALHYRRCPDIEAELVAAVEAGLADMASSLKLLHGNKVIEIRPAGADKGTAIGAFMQEAPFAGRTPVFVGDDVTDEDGFRVVNDLGGVSVKVASGPSVATYRLRDTADVMDWLEAFVKEGGR